MAVESRHATKSVWDAALNRLAGDIMIELVAHNYPLSIGEIFYYEPRFMRYVCEILPNPKHISNDFIVISGNGFIPYRVIAKKDVISIDGEPVSYDVKPVVADRNWLVCGSRGNHYTVKKTPDGWSCTCPGFSFRRECKHITSLQNESAAV